MFSVSEISGKCATSGYISANINYFFHVLNIAAKFRYTFINIEHTNGKVCYKNECSENQKKGQTILTIFFARSFNEVGKTGVYKIQTPATRKKCVDKIQTQATGKKMCR